MNINDHLLRIIEFFEEQSKYSIKLKVFEIDDSLEKFLKSTDIRLELGSHRDIVLKEELGIELGGIGKKSFSLIYPTQEQLDDNRDFIYLLGDEIFERNDKNLNFGLFILIQLKEIKEPLFDEIRQFSIISDSIEGLSQRTIPRKFWCRISKELIEKNFSFEFLAKAFIFLYKQKYEDFIHSIKIFMVNSDKSVVEDFLNLVSDIQLKVDGIWRDKVNNWKKRIDCEYSWTCEICPYLKSCQNIQLILKKREELER
ncbi:MAG: hypothetical protein ACQERB_03925 [Promethearchaeati archaeon]